MTTFENYIKNNPHQEFSKQKNKKKKKIRKSNKI